MAVSQRDRTVWDRYQMESRIIENLKSRPHSSES